MELPVNKELAVTTDAIKYARIIAAPIEDAFQRKRAYASIIALDALADFFVTQGVQVNISKNLFKIAPVNEEFEISDLCHNGWKVDVRIVFDNDFISIPKSHFKYDIVADFYVGIKVDTSLEKVEVIGFTPKEKISKSVVSGNYYLMGSEALSPIEELILVLKDQNQEYNEPVEHNAFENYYLSYLDKEIDSISKKAFIKHLMECSECRSNFVEIYDFEAIVRNMSSRAEFFEDHTLSIIGAQAVDSAKYADKEEEIIEIVDVEGEIELEPIDSSENEDILGELFANSSNKIEDNDGGDGGLGLGVAAGTVATGALIAGAAVSASAQANLNTASDLVETGLSIAKAGINAVSDTVGAIIPELEVEKESLLDDSDFETSIDSEDNLLLFEDEVLDIIPEEASEDSSIENSSLVENEVVDPVSELANLNAKNGEFCDLSSFDVELIPPVTEQNLVIIDDNIIPLLPEDELVENVSECDCFNDFEEVFSQESDLQYNEEDDDGELIEFDDFDESDDSVEKRENVVNEDAGSEFNFLSDADDIFKELKAQDELELSVLSDEIVDEAQVTSDFLAELSKTLDDTLVEFDNIDTEAVEEVQVGEYTEGEMAEIIDEDIDSFVMADEEEEGDLITLTDESEYSFEPSNSLQEDVTSSDDFAEFIDAGNEMKTDEEDLSGFENPIQLSYGSEDDEEQIEEGEIQLIGDFEYEDENTEDSAVLQNDEPEIIEQDFEEYSPLNAETKDEQDLQMLYNNPNNNINMPDEVDNQIEYMVNKPDGLAFIKNKKVVIAASLILGCLILSSVFGAVAYKNKAKTEAEQIETMNPQVQDPLTSMMPEAPGIPIDGQEGMPIASGDGSVQEGMELAKGSTASAPKDLNRAMTNVFDENPSSVTVTKISWEVPQFIASSELFTKYLQIAGKNLQINLKNDLMNATEFAYNDSVKVLVEVGKDNNIKKLEILNTSGSQQVDEIVLQSIKATLKYINVPQLPNSADLGQVNPTMNKLLKANVYPLTLVINF